MTESYDDGRSISLEKSDAKNFTVLFSIHGEFVDMNFYYSDWATKTFHATIGIFFSKEYCSQPSYTKPTTNLREEQQPYSQSQGMRSAPACTACRDRSPIHRLRNFFRFTGIEPVEAVKL